MSSKSPTNRVHCDAEELKISINQIGITAIRGISSVMAEEGEIMLRLAKSFAPVDKYNLEDAIEMEIDKSGINRRLSVKIFVDMRKSAGTNKEVGDYANLINYGLAPYGSGIYNLGPKSLAKRQNGNDVGGMFMDRAAAARIKILYEKVMSITKRALR